MARLTGAWQTAGAKLRYMGENLDAVATKTLKRVGEDMAQEMRNHIERQDLPWAPLSPQTVKLKGSSVVYVETGALLENGFKVRVLREGAKGSAVFVGANPWTKHTPSGLRMNQLLTELEYGTDKIPARPIVRPTFEEFKSKFPKEMAEYISIELGKGGV